MSLDLEDTIVAIASAPGGALRGIVRISGPRTADCVANLARLEDGTSLDTSVSPSCSRATMLLPAPLGDVPLVLYFWPTERSYTRQPSAELHLPGSPPILEAAVGAVCRAGARLARPGEFTLRAFLAGRLDLTQAEAVLGVIEAREATELAAALAQLAGGLARPLNALRDHLLNLLAHLEAGLDFVEEDIEFISRDELARELAAAHEQIAALVAQMRSRGEAGALPRVVLTGLPNAGKSSLLNALAGEQAAIVSDVAGTTRDFVARRITIDGRTCLVTDTAGIMDASGADQVSAAAQRLARQQAAVADLTIVCLDSSRPLAVWEREQLDSMSNESRLVVWTKCDLLDASGTTSSAGIRTSSQSGLGLTDLRRAIGEALTAASGASGVVAGTAERCRESLRLAEAALWRASAAATSAQGEEWIAAELRAALDELGCVVGAIYTDDILDRVFSRFCIGK